MICHEKSSQESTGKDSSVYILSCSFFLNTEHGLYPNQTVRSCLGNLWDSHLSKQEDGKLFLVQTHSDRLTGLVEATGTDWFATSSLDGTIKVWSMIENKLLSKINEEQDGFGGKHKDLGAFGVAGIDHCKQDQSYLLSWGFHSEVLIWQPLVSPTHPLIRKYAGHVGILNSARFLETS